MVVCGLAKQLFVSIAFMALFAMLTMNVHKGTELSRHTKQLFVLIACMAWFDMLALFVWH